MGKVNAHSPSVLKISFFLSALLKMLFSIADFSGEG
jgi:hypothetical protein